MTFLKRPEVWILLLLCFGGIAWILWSDQKHDQAEAGEGIEESDHRSKDAESATAQFEIVSRRISREEDHLIVSIRIRRSEVSESDEPFALVEPDVRLTTEDGSTISPFFFPFDPSPVLDPEQGASAEVRYWLTLAQASGPLWLEIDGDRLSVKGDSISEASFPDRFPEGVEVAVGGTDWRQ